MFQIGVCDSGSPGPAPQCRHGQYYLASLFLFQNQADCLLKASAILVQRKPRVLYLPPSIIEALSQIPTALDAIKHAESLVFAGGPLARPVGDILSEHIKLSSSCRLFETHCLIKAGQTVANAMADGSTEIGNVPCLLPQERADWEWLTWHPALKIQMELSVENAHELVINADKEADEYRGIGQTILKTQPRFRSRDLFTVKLWSKTTTTADS